MVLVCGYLASKKGSLVSNPGCLAPRSLPLNATTLYDCWSLLASGNCLVLVSFSCEGDAGENGN